MRRNAETNLHFLYALKIEDVYKIHKELTLTMILCL